MIIKRHLYYIWLSGFIIIRLHLSLPTFSTQAYKGPASLKSKRDLHIHNLVVLIIKYFY